MQSYTGEKSSKMGAGCRFLTYIRARETSSSLGRRRRPLHSEPAPLRCGPARRSHLTSSSRHEPPRAARRRELSQAGATAASAAPSSPRILHQGRISARMMADLINSISSCARPSQHARRRPKRSARASSFLSRVRLIDLIGHQGQRGAHHELDPFLTRLTHPRKRGGPEAGGTGIPCEFA